MCYILLCLVYSFHNYVRISFERVINSYWMSVSAFYATLYVFLQIFVTLSDQWLKQKFCTEFKLLFPFDSQKKYNIICIKYNIGYDLSAINKTMNCTKVQKSKSFFMLNGCIFVCLFGFNINRMLVWKCQI
jgi:hypothetical protein